MKALENRTLDSKREMDILDKLQDIRTRNARNERVAQAGGADILDRIARDEVEEAEDRQKQLEDEEDDLLVREVFSKVNAAGPSALPSVSATSPDEETPKPTPTVTIKRKADGEEPELHKLLSENAKTLLTSKAPTPAVKKQKTAFTNSLGIKLVKKGKAPIKAAS